MPVPFPGSQISIVLDPDGVRRFASSERQSQPARILAVVDRVPYTRDPSGSKHAYVPFSSAIGSDGHLAQRSERGLHFDFAVTLCDSHHRPVATLSGTCKNGELGTAILDSIAEFTGTCRIASAAAIDIVIPNSDGLGFTDLLINPVFCLNPSWLFGANLESAVQANRDALVASRSRATVIAYTDGSLPHHGNDRGAGAMVTLQGHWATQIAPKNFSRSSLMAETTGALLALRYTPVDFDLAIYSDSRAIVNAINNIVSGEIQTRQSHHNALELSIVRRSGRTKAVWVRGHAGNRYNDAADRMAVLMARHYNARIDPTQTHSLMQKILEEELAGLALAS